MKFIQTLMAAGFGLTLLAGCHGSVEINTTPEEVATTDCPMAVLVDTPTITAPPAELKLDPFYKKYMNVNGIHVVSSWRVPDSCFYAAYISIKALTDVLPAEVMESLTSRNTRIGIMARYEGTTDIPEQAFVAKDTTLNWDVRARGLGGD
ncbi:MAG: hypothetical protein PUF04_06585, partial [bacterium]|nr:hypothetical protein [bacterium]